MAEKNVIAEEIKNVIASLIEKVDALTEGKTCVFRGENKNYGKIACTLYREQKKIIEEIIKEEGEQKDTFNKLDFPAIEQEIIDKARSHFPALTTEFEILTELQHYGGKTTLIDCTRNILIALFFACNGETDQDGRVICLDTEYINTAQDLYGEKYKDDKPLLLSPQSKRNRPTFQGSVFVHAPKGFLEEDTVNEKDIITIESGQKEAYRQALQRYHGIDATTVFNDLQGFITNEDTHKTLQTYFYIGMSYDNKGEHEKAIEYYTKAIELDQNYAVVYNNRGLAKMNLQRHEEAIADYDEAIRLDPDLAASYYNRGNAQYKSKQYDEAIADYDKAIAIDPGHASAYSNRGLAKAVLGEYDEAIEDYDEAIRLNPDDATAYNNRGTAKDELQRYDEAITDYDTAIRLDPDDAMAYNNRGVTHKALGDQAQGDDIAAAEYYTKALQDYTKARELEPSSYKYMIELVIKELLETLQRLRSKDKGQ